MILSKVIVFMFIKITLVCLTVVIVFLWIILIWNVFCFIKLFFCSDFIYFVVKHFGLSLLHGNQYIYQSMPKLLSLWLDYGTLLADYEKQEKLKSQSHASQNLPAMRTTLTKLNKVWFCYYLFTSNCTGLLYINVSCNVQDYLCCHL